MMRGTTLTMVMGLLVLAGCAAEAGQELVLQEGLNVLEAEVGELALAFRAGDTVVFMEAVRGGPTPEPYQEAENMPNHEVDTMFTDEAGYIFYSRMGGHGWVDTSWNARVEEQDQLTPAVGSNAQLYRMLGDAAATMRADIEAQVGPELAADLGPEIDAVLEFAAIAPDVYERELHVLNAHRLEQGEAEVDIDRVLVEGGDVAYGTNGSETGTYTGGAGYYYLRLGKDSLGWYTFGGHHSATTLHRWVGSWLRVHDNTNHGRAGSAMEQGCLFQYYDTNVAGDYFSTVYAGHCAGSYAADSDGSNGGHNCHDDSRVQFHNFVHGSSLGMNGGTYQYWCNGNDGRTDISGGTEQGGYPSCSSDCRKGYGFCD